MFFLKRCLSKLSGECGFVCVPVFLDRGLGNILHNELQRLLFQLKEDIVVHARHPRSMWQPRCFGNPELV